MLGDQLWPETAPGYTAVGTPCPCTEAEGQLAARVTRQCVGTYRDGASWGPVDDSQCRDRLSGRLCVLFQVNIYLRLIINPAVILLLLLISESDKH